MLVLYFSSEFTPFSRICAVIRREHFPDHDSLPGHSITMTAPLILSNLLPVDTEWLVNGYKLDIASGKRLLVTEVNGSRSVENRV